MSARGDHALRHGMVSCLHERRRRGRRSGSDAVTSCGLAALAAELLDALRDMHAGQRAFRGDEGLGAQSRAWRATGRPTFSATSKLLLLERPRSRHGRSSARSPSTSASGISRSISAAFWPMFCARAWQAMCTRRRRRERLQAGRQAFLPGDVDDVFADVEGRVGQASAPSRSSGRISGHSNFSISAQDGTSATTS